MSAKKTKRRTTATDPKISSPPLVYDPVAFRPVPDLIPEMIGFWGTGGKWQGWDKRRAWLLANVPSPRRQRLAACAFALRSLPVFAAKRPGDDRPANAIAVAERYADGQATDEERRDAAYAAYAAYAAADADAAYAAADADAADAAYAAYAADAADAAYAAADAAYAAYAAYAADAAADAERINQSRVLSLVVPLAGWSPSWQTEATVGLARGIYDDKAWNQFPVLADALDDAGCDHPWLLAALRHPDCPGFRGMWVIDRLTGREC